MAYPNRWRLLRKSAEQGGAFFPPISLEYINLRVDSPYRHPQLLLAYSIINAKNKNLHVVKNRGGGARTRAFYLFIFKFNPGKYQFNQDAVGVIV